MKKSSPLTLLLSATLVAAAPKTSGICTQSTSVVNGISNPTGSSYCASLLRIPQSTTTTTLTFSPEPTTITKTTRVASPSGTVTKTRTRRKRTTVTDVSTTQLTHSTTLTSAAFSATPLDCISRFDQLKPYTTTVHDSDETFTVEEARKARKDHDGDDVALEKRAPAPSALKGQSRRRRRAFCSCLGLTSGTVTETASTTLAKETKTTTSTSIVSAQATTRTTTVITETKSIVSTSTLDPTTSPVTEVLVTPTPKVYPGVAYYAFHNEYNYGRDDPGFDATTWNSDDYEQSGIITDINFEHTNSYGGSGGNADSCSLPNGDFNDCTQSTIVNQGFFHAIADGVYTISSDNTIDNGMYVWSGDKAYDNYHNDNVDYNAERKGSVVITTGSAEYQLSAGDLVPFTIMAVNGGGPGRAQISVTRPNGERYGTDGFFIPACPADNPFSP